MPKVTWPGDEEGCRWWRVVRNQQWLSIPDLPAALVPSPQETEDSSLTQLCPAWATGGPPSCAAPGARGKPPGVQAPGEGSHSVLSLERGEVTGSLTEG